MAAPDVEANEQLNGQILEVEVAALSDNIGAFKARLAEVRRPPALLFFAGAMAFKKHLAAFRSTDKRP